MNLIEALNTVLTNPNRGLFFSPSNFINEKSFLFKKAEKKLVATSKAEFEKSLLDVNDMIIDGFVGFGYITYEAGYLLEQKLLPLIKVDSENVFSKFYISHPENVADVQLDESDFEKIKIILQKENYSIGDFRLTTSKNEYISNVEKIRNYIANGDTYQVNYTMKDKFNFSGAIQSLILLLIFNQSAKYIAVINDEDEIIISISPELFFKTEGSRIICKPMKGTRKRGINLHDDELQYSELLKSSKDRAENIMIVDLMRNDIGKICENGTVRVKQHFEIEKYESLFQMTSTVTGKLKEKNFETIIKNLFPCGSITGAPKIRTMEIISEIENEVRGVYTGAIGMFNKNEFTFNVPIRTIVLNRKNNSGEIGIGSGIVWDSIAENEYEETKLKANFLLKPEKYFELIETMLAENGEVFLLDFHLDRLESAAEYFLFNFSLEKIKSEIAYSINQLTVEKKYKLRLLLNKWGGVSIKSELLTDMIANPTFYVSDKRIDSRNKYQYFKTTNRAVYDSEYRKAVKRGCFDVIFLNEKDEIVEGAISNIFIKKGEKLFTPPIECGVLNGCYRRHLLETNPLSSESKICSDDLANANEILLVNSVRGIVRTQQMNLD
ncbi:MAG: aminodeoxychorismate synthase component I [Bacteroidetes bacterium]|nr:aminodeoxychorismate synthase component I [Bacteroidota bacterium]MBU1680088.1 aminodeoxychorismate synthase component I [Bacteroidota bacterium]MBU2507897.1 aminodeoxychorismate synthase component I [Bacteroidota bacterium]